MSLPHNEIEEKKKDSLLKELDFQEMLEKALKLQLQEVTKKIIEIKNILGE